MSELQESLAQKFSKLPIEEQEKIWNNMTPAQMNQLNYDWNWWGRPKQLKCFEEDNWSTFLYLCGRGFGKTRTGTEWVKHIAETRPGSYIAVVGPTTQSVNRTLVEGPTGLTTICDPSTIHYQRTKAQIRWKNGSVAMLYSAEKPDRLRGPNHHYALADEIVAWKNPETWDMLKFTLRIGVRPQTLVTTTPRPTDLVLKIIGGEDNVGRVNSHDYIRFKKTIIVRGTTFENTALSEDALAEYKDIYFDTVMGDQELYAKLLVNIQGALFKKEWIRHHGAYADWQQTEEPRPEPVYVQTVVAVDPAATAKTHSDQTAICVVSKGEDGRYYVRHCEGHQLSPDKWAQEVVKAYYKYNANKIVVEVNNGGDMVENTIRHVKSYVRNKRTYTVDAYSIPVEKIHAKKGKFLRAEEVALLYEQGRVTHIHSFTELESQMIVFKGEPNGADDLVDAMVYGIKELAGVRLVESTRPIVIGEGLVSDRLSLLY
jgi:predicted phage terminase large subunit-like protein